MGSYYSTEYMDGDNIETFVALDLFLNVPFLPLNLFVGYKLGFYSDTTLDGPAIAQFEGSNALRVGAEIPIIRWIELKLIGEIPLALGASTVSLWDGAMVGAGTGFSVQADGSAPRVVRAAFPGTILPIDGKIFGVEVTSTGFVFSSYDDQLKVIKKKNLTFFKLKHSTVNRLDESSSGNFHEEDNISSYFVAYPYIVFTSVNYKTDKYYRYTHYQSEEVSSSTMAFACVNILTGETFKSQEADYAAWYKANIAKDGPSGALTPSASAFWIVNDGNTFVFTLGSGTDEYVNGYFSKDPEGDATLYADSAETIAKKFPTLVLESRATPNAKERKILDQAGSSSSPLTLDGQERIVLGYQWISNDGFLIYTQPTGGISTRCSLYYTDLTLETVRWKRDFKPGIVVSQGGLNAASGNVTLPDLDESGEGMLFVKVLADGHEANIFPVNLYQAQRRMTYSDFLVFGDGVVLYDDQTSSISCFTRPG